MNPKLFFILAGAVIAILLIGEARKLAPAKPAPLPQVRTAPHAFIEPPPSVPAEIIGNRRESCTEESEIAGLIMKRRQQGGIMSDMLKKVSKVANGGSDPITDATIVLAFEEPRYGSPGHQERAVVDFQNEMFQACLLR